MKSLKVWEQSSDFFSAWSQKPSMHLLHQEKKTNVWKVEPEGKKREKKIWESNRGFMANL